MGRLRLCSWNIQFGRRLDLIVEAVRQNPEFGELDVLAPFCEDEAELFTSDCGVVEAGDDALPAGDTASAPLRFASLLTALLSDCGREEGWSRNTVIEGRLLSIGV